MRKNVLFIFVFPVALLLWLFGWILFYFGAKQYMKHERKMSFGKEGPATVFIAKAEAAFQR